MATQRITIETKANSYQEMASIIARFAPADGMHKTPIGNLFVSRRSAPSQSTHVTQSPIFVLVVQGAKSLVVGSDVFSYGVGDYLVVSLDVPVIARVTKASAEEPNLSFGFKINPAPLSRVLSRANITMPSLAADEVRSIAVERASPPLLDASLRLLRLLDTPGDIPGLWPLIEQEILYHLLVGPFGPRLLRMGTADSSSNRIAKAVGWLRQHFAEPLSVEKLGEQTGMSRSSLHQHFRAITGMSPLQYQKQLRLQEARRLMVIEGLTIGHASYRVGYESPSQFSREYRRLFGNPPQTDVGRMRGTMPEAAA